MPNRFCSISSLSCIVTGGDANKFLLYNLCSVKIFLLILLHTTYIQVTYMQKRSQYQKTTITKRKGQLRHLPTYYAKALRERLILKGFEYSVHTIRSVVSGVRDNPEILNEAIIYASECRKIKIAAGR